jgi:hypothetical protein
VGAVEGGVVGLFDGWGVGVCVDVGDVVGELAGVGVGVGLTVGEF